MTAMSIPAPTPAGASAALTANRSRALAAIRPLGLGRVSEMVGLHLRVTGLRAAVGDLLEVQSTPPVLVEVAASSTEGLVCLPLGRLTGIQVGAYVRHTGGPARPTRWPARPSPVSSASVCGHWTRSCPAAAASASASWPARASASRACCR